MVRQIGMGYGIWESLAHLAGNRLGGHEKVWVTGVYGLSQVWIKTEATVEETHGRGDLIIYGHMNERSHEFFGDVKRFRVQSRASVPRGLLGMV